MTGEQVGYDLDQVDRYGKEPSEGLCFHAAIGDTPTRHRPSAGLPEPTSQRSASNTTSP